MIILRNGIDNMTNEMLHKIEKQIPKEMYLRSISDMGKFYVGTLNLKSGETKLYC